MDARARLVFAKAIFQRTAADRAAPNAALEGIVVIFDSADGGIVGTTFAVLKQFIAGALSPESFWKQCYRDPLETFQESPKP